MNRTWIRRAMGAAVLAGGLLLAGAGTASAGIPIASADGPVAHSVSAPGGLVAPVLSQGDPVSGGDLVTQALPYNTDQGTEYSAQGDDLVSGVGTPDNQPQTNGMTVDGSTLTHTAGGLVQPVTQPASQQAGSVSGPLGGLNGGGEAAALPLPIAAPNTVLPLGATAEDFTVGQNNQLPTDGLVQNLGPQAGTAVTQAVTGGTPNLPGESAREGAVDGLASGAAVAGLPLNSATQPVTSHVDTDGVSTPQGGNGDLGAIDPSGEGASPTQDGAPVAAPAAPAAPTGDSPLDGVTSLLGGSLPLGG